MTKLLSLNERQPKCVFQIELWNTYTMNELQQSCLSPYIEFCFCKDQLFLFIRKQYQQQVCIIRSVLVPYPYHAYRWNPVFTFWKDMWPVARLEAHISLYYTSYKLFTFSFCSTLLESYDKNEKEGWERIPIEIRQYILCFL